MSAEIAAPSCIVGADTNPHTGKISCVRFCSDCEAKDSKLTRARIAYAKSVRATFTRATLCRECYSVRTSTRFAE